MVTTYRSEAAALARADAIRREHGIWPGVRRCPGGWRLTVDVDQARPGSGSDRPGLRQQPTGRGGDFQGDREPCSGTSRL